MKPGSYESVHLTDIRQWRKIRYDSNDFFFATANEIFTDLEGISYRLEDRSSAYVQSAFIEGWAHERIILWFNDRGSSSNARSYVDIRNPVANGTAGSNTR